MIQSRNSDGTPPQRGFAIPLRQVSGAVAARVVEGSYAKVEAHSHDWPVLSIYVLGECARLGEGTMIILERPGVVFQPAGAVHSNAIGANGFEQIDIQFDPAWLGPDGSRLRGIAEIRSWQSGPVMRAAHSLARLWHNQDTSNAALSVATLRFFTAALNFETPQPPAWLDTILNLVREGHEPTLEALSLSLNLHPSWICQAYRAAVGEGLRQTLQRKKVERAITLLRTTVRGAAEVAVEAGFCDQSHMIRTFKRFLARTPQQVRKEAAQLTC